MFDILREASELSHPGYGAWLFDTWAAHNDLYFGGQLAVIPIIWGLLPHGAALGLFSSSPRRITLHLSLVNPSSDAWRLGKMLGVKFASDVLLHEMMHQHIFERDGKSTEGHNNQQWADEINRIAPLLGLPANAQPVKQRRIKADGTKGKGKVAWVAEEGKMLRLEMATWPHSQRPAEYYEISAVSK